MAYQGSAAYRLDAYQSAWEAPIQRPLSVHEGGRLDARARADASASLATLVRAVVAVTLALVVLGAARVALTAQTVALLRDVRVAESTVAGALDTRTALSVERSALTSTDRIQRIATENYGMVYASAVDTIVLPQEAPDCADDAQGADVADPASPQA